MQGLKVEEGVVRWCCEAKTSRDDEENRKREKTRHIQKEKAKET